MRFLRRGGGMTFEEVDYWLKYKKARIRHNLLPVMPDLIGYLILKLYKNFIMRSPLLRG
jgi:hypothetical protein